MTEFDQWVGWLFRWVVTIIALGGLLALLSCWVAMVCQTIWRELSVPTRIAIFCLMRRKDIVRHREEIASAVAELMQERESRLAAKRGVKP